MRSTRSTSPGSHLSGTPRSTSKAGTGPQAERRAVGYAPSARPADPHAFRILHGSSSQAYMARRITEGKTKKEAMRCLKRYLARQLYRIIRTSSSPPTTTSPPAAKPPTVPPRNVSVTAGCGVCGRPLPPGHRRWCGDACRQAAWRRRHQPSAPLPELPAARPRKAGTVYACPDCDTRLLGEQRCDCGTFMRRLGPGGLCPCCNEPVTLDELLEG